MKEMTQLNTRIPADLKRAGDEVLARAGATTSDVIRAVWSYMVAHQSLPPCAEGGAVSAEDAFQQARQRIEEGPLLAARLLSGAKPAGAVSKEEAREMLADELWARYEAL